MLISRHAFPPHRWWGKSIYKELVFLSGINFHRYDLGNVWFKLYLARFHVVKIDLFLVIIDQGINWEKRKNIIRKKWFTHSWNQRLTCDPNFATTTYNFRWIELGE